jgi:DNA-binding XRE family transcriptional regulator
MRKPPIPTPIDLPEDYAERVILTRHALRMTLSEFAERIGAASKAVVYQWESGKRKPSSVFWARIVRMRSTLSPCWQMLTEREAVPDCPCRPAPASPPYEPRRSP